MIPLHEKLLSYFDASQSASHDIFGRVYMLNLVRPLTKWRKIRAFLGFHEKDTMKSGFINKPKIIRVDGKRAIQFGLSELNEPN